MYLPGYPGKYGSQPALHARGFSEWCHLFFLPTPAVAPRHPQLAYLHHVLPPGLGVVGGDGAARDSSTNKVGPARQNDRHPRRARCRPPPPLYARRRKNPRAAGTRNKAARRAWTSSRILAMCVSAGTTRRPGRDGHLALQATIVSGRGSSRPGWFTSHHGVLSSAPGFQRRYTPMDAGTEPGSWFTRQPHEPDAAARRR